MNVIKKYFRGEADIADEALVLIFIGLFGGAILGGLLGMVYNFLFK